MEAEESPAIVGSDLRLVERVTGRTDADGEAQGALSRLSQQGGTPIRPTGGRR